MNDNEAIDMMRRASGEIKSLRAEVERLRPKAEAYDTMARVIDLLPHRSVGAGEDIAWKLDKRIEELKAQMAKAVKDETLKDAAAS